MPDLGWCKLAQALVKMQWTSSAEDFPLGA